jgi:hypothetical protein
MTADEHRTFGVVYGRSLPPEARQLRADRAAAFLLIVAGTRYPADLARQVIALRGATDAERPIVLRMILDARADWLAWLTRTQRHWQAAVSRRPSRGRHHDSWTLRESYMRQEVQR